MKIQKNILPFRFQLKKEYDNDSGETITYKIKLIDRCRFMPSKLSNLVNSLSEINKKLSKACMERRNIKSECEFIWLIHNRLQALRCNE